MMLEEVKGRRTQRKSKCQKEVEISQQNVTKDDVGRQMREKNISEDM